MKFYLEQIDSVFKQVNSSEQGISTAEAERRLAENGKNKLEEGKKKTTLQRVFEQLSDPMIIILIVAAVISAITSEISALGLNIENMINQSKGANAYTIIDVAGDINADVVDKLKAVEGIIRVRVI